MENENENEIEIENGSANENENVRAKKISFVAIRDFSFFIAVVFRTRVFKFSLFEF